MTDDRIAELLGWPRGRANRDSSLMHRIRIVVAEAQAELDGHIYRLREQIARDTAQIERMLAEVERLRAELAESKQDAARYRWLREQHWSESPLAVVVDPARAVKLGHDLPSLFRLDAAIDAAMRKEGDDAR